MALKSETSGSFKLVGTLVLPSWSSTILTILVSLLIVGGTILLAHIGGATQQSLLGLHTVYQQSSLGISTHDVGQHLSSNTVFNNTILFLLWGSVGLVVYSIVQGVATELKNTDELLRELAYVHVDRRKVLRNAILRAIVRLIALVAWWFLAWFMFHTIIPYAIASAHLSAYNLKNVHDWLHTVFGVIYCMFGIHGLVVLLRLIVLRPRLTGNSLIDS